MWQQGAVAVYTSNISFCSRKDTSKENPLVNIEIFIGLKDLYAELPGLSMLDFFLSITSMTRFGAYPIIHMQTINMVKVKTAITRMYYKYDKLLKDYDPKCFLFHERRMQKMHICQWALF